MMYGGIDFVSGMFRKATKQEWIKRYQDNWEYIANMYLVFCGMIGKLSCPVCKEEFSIPSSLKLHFKNSSRHIVEAFFDSRVEVDISGDEPT